MKRFWGVLDAAAVGCAGVGCWAGGLVAAGAADGVAAAAGWLRPAPEASLRRWSGIP